MAILKVEPFSGVSGDMFLGALVELSRASDDLRNLPEALNLPQVSIEVSLVEKCGITGTKVNIVFPHEHVHRHLPDIHEIIDAGNIPQSTKERAKGIFQLLGESEAKAHGIPIEKVHFHEVGALDAILDIVGSAMLLDKLGIDEAYTDPVRLGFGFVKAAHGQLPIPAPATRFLLEGIPTFRGDTEKEMSTPTGAAILRSLKPKSVDKPFKLGKPAYGAGSADFEHPNMLRLSLVQEYASTGLTRESGRVLLQTNIDNTSGEFMGRDFQTKLFEAGALDVATYPVVMKKGRPGIVLEVYCPMDRDEQVASVILNETNTLGVRRIESDRYILQREIHNVDTSFGSISVKVATLPNGDKRVMPEYEDCRKAAEASGVPVWKVYEAAKSASSALA